MLADSPPVLVPFNDLARGLARDRSALDIAIADVLSSGRVILGPRVREFEKAIASYVRVAEAVGVASGTDALELALRAVMPEGRSTVLTAANAGGYTSAAAFRAGFKVRWADIDPKSFCLSVSTIEAATTEDVGVVVVTHLYGRLADIEAIVEFCSARGIRVVEDCAQAIGASRAGRRAGSFGDAAAVSFYPTKNLGALGDGGAVMTDDAEIAARLRQLRQYGWVGKYYVAISGGVNSRLDEIQAAALLVRLPQLDKLNSRRRAIIAQYRRAAAGTVAEVASALGSSHVGHLAVVVVPSDRRESVRAHLARHGVSTDVHFPVPDHHQPGFRQFGAQHLPTTEDLAGRIFSLPCFPELTDVEVGLVCAALSSLDREAS